MAPPTFASSSANRFRGTRFIAVSFCLALSVSLIAASPASADTVLDGPVDLGRAASFAVLGASTVTNTGPTIVSGDLGLYAGSSVTGFGGPPDGTIVNGSLHLTDTDAANAQTDASAAFTVAAGLSPKESGLVELSNLVLNPGVYSGGAVILSNNGTLTLDGDADSVWVFQVGSTLTIGSATNIVFTGGAGACNVFWRVAESASIGTGANFAGTVVADQSISLTSGATVSGRLFALVGAVTLINNRVTAPLGCAADVDGPSESVPSEITSGPPTDATVGTPYAYAITATGSPNPEYLVTDGELPLGLTLDDETGIISGIPTEAGDSTFTITADTGTTDVNDSAEYVMTVLAAAVGSAGGPQLTASGSDLSQPISIAVMALLAGLGLLLAAARVRRTQR